jgi:hypothetical protein
MRQVLNGEWQMCSFHRQSCEDLRRDPRTFYSAELEFSSLTAAFDFALQVKLGNLGVPELAHPQGALTAKELTLDAGSVDERWSQ